MPGFAGYSCGQLGGERVPTPNVSNTRKLHPLHTVEFLTALMNSTGAYPDIERKTGRSTIIALSIIVKALENPHTPIPVRDHHPTQHSHIELEKNIHDMRNKLGLQHFHCSQSRLTVTFGTDSQRGT